MLQEVNWKKENSVLEEEASSNRRLQKELVKEAEVDQGVQQSMCNRVQSLRQAAATLSKTLQKERFKHNQLDRVLFCVRQSMEQGRVTDGPQGLESCLQSREKKLQYDLSQVNSRKNRINETVVQQRFKVNQIRTERVIDSGIYRNIQKQLSDSQMNFKKLLIEKTHHQLCYQKLLAEYHNIKNKSLTSISISRNNIPQQKQQFLAKKFTELGLQHNREANHITGLKFPKQLMQEEEEQQKQYMMRRILLETGITDPSEFIYLMQNVQKMNEEKFILMENMADEATKLQKQITTMHEAIQKNQMVFYKKSRILTKGEKKLKVCTELTQKLKQIEGQINKEQKALDEFMEDSAFKVVLDQTNTQNNNLQVSNLLKIFQEKVLKFLTPVCKDEVAKQETQCVQRLDELLGKIKKGEECDKILRREDFAEDYRNMIKNTPARIFQKRKSLPFRK